MKLFTAAALILATAGVASAASSTSSVVVVPSSLSYKQIAAACPGALAGIGFTLNHLRIAEAPGVSSDIDSANASAQTILLSLGAQSASVRANAAKHTIAAKHATLASHDRVACIAHD